MVPGTEGFGLDQYDSAIRIKNGRENGKYGEKRMTIGVIQASSQVQKNLSIFNAVKRYAPDSPVVNFGCKENEEQYSYIEISLLIGLLLASGAVDFIVTGCSSGQGMMLACNNMPGVLCGYAPSPMDAYLFAQINNGNAISLPLGEEYTWSGIENLEKTIEKLFSEPFGQGYPKGEEERKLKDTLLLKDITNMSQVSIIELMKSLDIGIVSKIMNKIDVIQFIIDNGNNKEIVHWLSQAPGVIKALPV